MGWGGAWASAWGVSPLGFHFLQAGHLGARFLHGSIEAFRIALNLPGADQGTNVVLGAPLFVVGFFVLRHIRRAYVRHRFSPRVSGPLRGGRGLLLC